MLFVHIKQVASSLELEKSKATTFCRGIALIMCSSLFMSPASDSDGFPLLPFAT